jgi:hypothetical protein
MAEFDADALKAAVEKALIYAILREDGKLEPGGAEEFADAMEVVVRMGPRAVHVALSAWCGLVLHGFAQDQGAPVRGDGFWSLEVEDDKTGESKSIDDIGDPATRDAMRIVACFGNKDHDTIAAIVKTAWAGDDEALADLLFAAVRLSALTARRLAAARGKAADGG